MVSAIQETNPFPARSCHALASSVAALAPSQVLVSAKINPLSTIHLKIQRGLSDRTSVLARLHVKILTDCRKKNTLLYFLLFTGLHYLQTLGSRIRKHWDAFLVRMASILT